MYFSSSCGREGPAGEFSVGSKADRCLTEGRPPRVPSLILDVMC